MKKLILLPILFLSLFSFSQEIKYDENYKLPDNIIVEVKGAKNKLYKKALDWVNKFYKNPSKAITAKTDNELLIINGACVNCLEMNVMEGIGGKDTNTLRYIIILDFKNDKYKFDLSSVTFENADDLKDGRNIIFKKNGEPKSVFKKYPEAIESELSYIFNSLKDYMSSNEEDNNNWYSTEKCNKKTHKYYRLTTTAFLPLVGAMLDQLSIIEKPLACE